MALSLPVLHVLERSSAKHAWRYAHSHGTFFINSSLCTVWCMQSFYADTQATSGLWLVCVGYEREERQKIFLGPQHLPAAVQETVYILQLRFILIPFVRDVLVPGTVLFILQSIQNLRLQSQRLFTVAASLSVVYLHKTLDTHYSAFAEDNFPVQFLNMTGLYADANDTVCTLVLNRRDLFAVFYLRFRPINYHSESHKPSSAFSMPAQLT